MLFFSRGSRMSSSMSNEKEQEFATQFITTLNRDISSSKHGVQTNLYVIEPAIHLLKNRHLCPQLDVQHIIRGAINMAIAAEDNKYGILKPQLIGNSTYNYFKDERDSWFGDYFDREGLAWELALPVITRASKSPLFMMTGCMAHTLALYCDFLKEMDVQYSVPKTPIKDSNYSTGYETNDNFSLEVFHQVIEQTYKEEEQFLNQLIANLQIKTQTLRLGLSQSENTIKTAESLVSTLRDTAKEYIDSESNPKITREYARKQFILKATQTINEAIPILEKELGWDDYLFNLLKKIGDVFLVATNTVFGSRYSLFSQAKAPLVQEVEDLNHVFEDSIKPDR